MYINCGPVTLTSTGSSQANFNSLPDMFKANIYNSYNVPNNKDVVFPNPGLYYTRINGAIDAFAILTGISCGTVGSGRPT